MMRRIGVGLAGGALVMLGGLAGAQGIAARSVTVQLFQFQPGALDVRAGTTIIFRNQDDILHTATSGTPDAPDRRFDVRLAGRGTTGEAILATPGVYPYFCSRHPSMRGEFRVR
jgi:plastocyanin